MHRWDARLRLDREGARLLVTDSLGHDRLKARLPLRPEHPRALLTLLEGVALYSGERIVAALSADDAAARSFASGVRGDEFMPIDSALVRWTFVELSRSGRRLRGLGDFRDLRGRYATEEP